MCGGHVSEIGVGAVFVRLEFHDVARAHILEHIIGIPCPFDDEVAVVLEPFHQGLGVLADFLVDAFHNVFIF